jgi:hypothetical protein
MTMKDVFEGSAVGLIAKASSESWIGKPINFEMVQTGGGDKVPNEDTTFKGFVARYDIAKLPKVHDDDVSYLLEYKVTVEGETRLASNKYTVWPALYEIEAVLEDDTEGKLCEFDVGGGSNRGLVTLDSHGKGHYEAQEAGAAPTFEVRSPYELVSWDKADGRKRKAKVKRLPYTASFWAPDYADIPSGLRFTSTAVTSTRGFWQVVNLDATESPWYGTSVRFKVGAKGDKARGPSARLGKQDDEIHVKVEFDPGNSKRNDDPKPGVIQKIGDPLVASTTATQTFTVKLGKNGEAGEFEVVVGAAGCDKIKVSIGVTSACQDDSYEIINDRKVFYQVTRNAGQEDPNLTRSEAALAKVGVSLSRYKILSLQPTDVAPTGVSWIDGAYFGATSARLNVGNYNSVFYHGKWADKGPNQKLVSPRLHVLYTDLQYDSYDPTVTNDNRDYLDINGQSLTKTDLVAWSDASMVVGVRFDLPMGDMGLFSRRLYDNSAPFVSGTWRKMGSATTGPFSAGDIWLTTTHLTVKLPAACKVHLDGNHTIGIVSIRLARARGPYLGEANNGKILCVVTEPSDDINDTLTHEIGHVIKLVPSTAAPPGLTLSDHTRRYVGNEHQGGHCAKGMSTSNYANGIGKSGTVYRRDFTDKAECTCVMYGEGNTACTGEFCDLCLPFGKAGKIT